MGELRLAIMRFSLALSLVCLAPAAWGQFYPTSICDLAGASDVIASGEIVEVGKKTFVFQVEDAFAGKVAPDDRLEIRKFHDWSCACRWGDYKIKERLFVFLTVAEIHGKKELHIRGAGDEGELPIVDGDVYFRPFSDEQSRNSIKYGTSKRKCGRFVKVPYDSFRDSIAGFRKCFEMEAERDRHREDGEIPACFSSIKQTCGNGDVVAFSAASDINRRLVDELKDEYQLTVKQFGRQSAPSLEPPQKKKKINHTAQ